MKREFRTVFFGFCLASLFGFGNSYAAIVDVTISGFAFHPSTVTVNQGDVVRWTNQDSIGHTTTSGSSCSPDGIWDSGLLSMNQSYSVAFPTAGSFPYFCRPHCSFMTGTVVVQPVANNPPLVSITSPTNGASFAAGTSVTIEATASDSDGTVTNVEFFDGTTSLGAVSSSPYSVTVHLGTGSHTLTAVATDNAGAATTSQAITVNVNAVPIPDPIPAFITKGDVRIDLETVVDGLASPLGMAVPDDASGRMFVYDQSGVVWVVTASGKLPTPLLNISSRLVPLAAYDERGLLGLAVHPNFAQHPLVYTYTSEPNGFMADFPSMMPAGKTNNCQSVLAEWQIDVANSNQVVLSSRREILRIDKPQSNHNGGTIQFGPDGFLYVGTGDGGAANDMGDGHMPGGNAQDTTMALGKMLRIDVSGNNSVNGQYGIPADNPFVTGGGLPEIYAYGLRNPYKWSFDRVSGQLYVGDVGQNHVEEVDILQKGGNFGWHVKEGTFWFDPATGNDVTTPVMAVPPNLIDPIAEYGHGDGLAVIGGYVYHGTAIPALQGRYVFGDWGSFSIPNGRLFYLDAAGVIRELRLGLDDRVAGLWVKGFGEGADGELYLFGSRILGPSGNTGKMLKIVPAPSQLAFTGLARPNSATVSNSWSGGRGPVALQEKASFSDFVWRNRAFTMQGGAAAPATNNASFFRTFDTGHQPAIPLTVVLNGAMDRPNPVATAAMGSGTLSLEGNTLTLNISYSGLSAPATAAHIHGPASTATATGIQIDLHPYHLGPYSTQGVFSGVVALTDAQKAMLLAGQTYVNIHDANHPAGEIRGQIAPVLMEIGLKSAVSQTGSPGGAAVGMGVLGLVRNQLNIEIGFQGLSGAPTGVFLLGPGVASGAISVDLTALLAGAPDGSGSLAGSVQLTPDQMANVIDGAASIEFRTTANPGGELRGQLWPQAAGTPLSAAMSATGNGTGSGAALFSLEGDTLLFSISYSNLPGVAAGANLHGPAPTSQTAPPLVDLVHSAEASLQSAGMLAGRLTLSPQQRQWVLGGQTYLELTTASVPLWQMRGQLAPILNISSLTGGQEQPAPVVTAGIGSGTLTLVGNQLAFDLSYGGLAGTASGAALRGPAGIFGSGGVLADLSSFNGGSWGTNGSVSGTIMLAATNLAAVIDGRTYLEFQSVSNSNGEIRGQLSR